MEKVEYDWKPGGLVTDTLLNECSRLYSDHYGFWSCKSPVSPGKNIKLSAKRIKKWLSSEYAYITLAKLDGVLVGYAMGIQREVSKYGTISWVTQLVVHEEYRHKGIGKMLLFYNWGFSTHFAWGILSSNPYAIRALEKVTRRRCSPKRIARNKKKLLNLGIEYIPYVEDDTSILVNEDASKINTKFYVDHSEINQMISNVITSEVPWILGGIEEGWEWFAFTFNDQEQIELTSDEIEEMIEASDRVTKQAYSRMQLNSSHYWTKHTESEVEQIINICELTCGNSVLDLGCGMGRHSIALAKKGFVVTGIDYIDKFVDVASENAMKYNSSVIFLKEDCRNVNLKQKFDAVICLYDVIGTFADEEENCKIVKNIFHHMKTNAKALISVMNYELTEKNAEYTFCFKNEPNKILNLPASQIMEKTGDVFNPKHYIIDKTTCIIYRKEQFAQRDSLPIELIVRDRRYRKVDIMKMCEQVGLEILWARYTNAGMWDTPLLSNYSNSKEILLLCRKP